MELGPHYLTHNIYSIISGHNFTYNVDSIAFDPWDVAHIIRPAVFIPWNLTHIIWPKRWRLWYWFHCSWLTRFGPQYCFYTIWSTMAFDPYDLTHNIHISFIPWYLTHTIWPTSFDPQYLSSDIWNDSTHSICSITFESKDSTYNFMVHKIRPIRCGQQYLSYDV